MGGTLLILALGISGCALPDVPEAVSWDTELQLPLAARTFGMWDLADNDSVLRAEGSGIGMTLPDSALFFSYSRELVPVRVGEKLKLDGFNHEIQQPMRMLKIPLGVEQTQAATLGAVNPALAARHGVVMDVPPYAFRIVVAVPLSGFRRACVDSGTVAIRVASSLPYAAQSSTVTWLADRDHPQAVYHGELSATQAAQAEAFAAREVPRRSDVCGGHRHGGGRVGRAGGFDTGFYHFADGGGAVRTRIRWAAAAAGAGEGFVVCARTAARDSRRRDCDGQHDRAHGESHAVFRFGAGDFQRFVYAGGAPAERGAIHGYRRRARTAW